jgi:hypothetical protein
MNCLLQLAPNLYPCDWIAFRWTDLPAVRNLRIQSFANSAIKASACSAAIRAMSSLGRVTYNSPRADSASTIFTTWQSGLKSIRRPTEATRTFTQLSRSSGATGSITPTTEGLPPSGNPAPNYFGTLRTSGTGQITSPNLAPIPEPSTGALLPPKRRHAFRMVSCLSHSEVQADEGSISALRSRLQ